MANNLSSNASEKLIRRFWELFDSNRIISKTINRSVYEGEFDPRTDTVIRTKRPHRYTTIETADGDISASTKNDIIAGSAFAEVQDYITVAVEYKQVEEALQLDQLGDGTPNMDSILGPVAEEMATKLDNNLLQFMIANASQQLGNAGTQIAVWKDVAQVMTHMKNMGFPAGRKYVALDCGAVENLADTQTGLASGNNRLVDTAWEDAMISNPFAGLTALATNSLPEITNGTYGAGPITVAATPTATYVSVKDTYQQSVALTGFTASTVGALRAGMVLEFTTGAADADSVFLINQRSRKPFRDSTGANVRFRATVTADADSDAGGNVTAIISGPALVDPLGQYDTVTRAIELGDAVTIVSGAEDTTQTPSIWYHENALSMASVRLPKLHSLDSRVISYDGISIRMHMYSDGDANLQKLRWDLLPAFGANNQFMCGPVYGR